MKKVNLVCPDCGQQEVYLTLEMVASEIGDFSLSGQQIKFNVSEVPVLVCCSYSMLDESDMECFWKLKGEIQNNQAVFVRP